MKIDMTKAFPTVAVGTPVDIGLPDDKKEMMDLIMEMVAHENALCEKWVHNHRLGLPGPRITPLDARQFNAHIERAFKMYEKSKIVVETKKENPT